MAISLPPHSGATLSRRLAGTESSPVRELLELAARPEVISLAGGLPAPDTFDVDGPARGVRRGPRRPAGAARAAVLDAPRATRALREQLCRALHAPAGCRATGDDVLVTTGSQQALGLIASALLDPGDAVLVEDPTYLAALQSFRLADARAVPDPVATTDGPTPEALLAARARAPARRPST